MKKLLLTCTDLMAVQFFLEHIAYWTENGYSVDVICSPVGERVEELKEKLSQNPKVSVKTVKLSRSPFKLSNFVGYKQMKAYIKQGKYDCIITNEPVMGLITRLAARKKSNRVIYIAHGFHFYRGGSKHKNFIYRTIERIAAHYTDALVTINKEDCEAAKKFRLKKNGKIEYIPGIGVNLERFISLEESERNIRREELGIATNEVAIVAIGELNKNKNQRILIEGLAKINNEKVKLFLIGKGDEREALENLAKSLNISDKVILLGYRRDVPNLLSAFDIGVSASYREGLGLNLIEEMACGLPIVASINRGHVDIVVEGCGYLFEPTNADGFVSAIQPLLDNSQLRYDIGQFNIQSSKRFSSKKVKSLLLEIINGEN